MVSANIDDNSQTGQIVLKPNYSWSWRYNLYLLYTLMGISITMSIGFLLMGAWIILPYSLLELVVVAACMHYCVWQCNKREVITVSEHDVHIEKGVNKPSEIWDYHRLWAKFLVQKPRHPWDPAIVSIRSHGKETELGSFLSKPDKTELIRQLKRVVPR
jgi:uncharacterized membrane protein